MIKCKIYLIYYRINKIKFVISRKIHNIRNFILFLFISLSRFCWSIY